MYVVRTRADLERLKQSTVLWRRPVGVTIGNFDGMHIGHRGLFDALENRLSEFSPEAHTKVLFTFSPHPKTVVNDISRRARRSDDSLSLVTPLREKCEQAERVGLDLLFVPRFTKRFAMTPADTFLRVHVFEAFEPKVVVVGHDWSFGRDRSGDHGLLKKVAADYGSVVEIVSAIELDIPNGFSGRVSTSAVKNAVRSGALDEARLLLGRPFAVSGLVIRGDGRGRKIGFPTANLHLPEQVVPGDGVYATWATINGRRVPSVTNVGVRPTFGASRRTVETHLLGWDSSEFYHQRLHLEFVQKLRGEKKFSGIDELQNAIAEDIKAAKTLLEHS